MSDSITSIFKKNILSILDLSLFIIYVSFSLLKISPIMNPIKGHPEWSLYLVYVFLLWIFSKYISVAILIRNIRWWQMKIEPSEFMIHKWFVENPENTMFTWSPWQLTHRTNMLLNSVQRDIIVPYVKKGDKVILWVHDKTIGIYAIGSVYEEPSYSNMDSKLIQYYTNFKELPPEILQVNIKLSVILHNDPISSVYCYKQGIANKPGPIKYPRRLPYEPPFQWSGFFSNPGKLDAYGWIPIKPIWRDIWEKSLEIIQSGTWHYS